MTSDLLATPTPHPIPPYSTRTVQEHPAGLEHEPSTVITELRQEMSQKRSAVYSPSVISAC